ncbi:LuxR C-terminal-related transcriptional regulator [Streptomyces europaeiscabiei]|uniref:helix-turn-helix transcriptional regulator n=1 Tax=Streptomyces europaeiscabiei TaxID=146819 RepID=UPI0029B52409|nr:LuxR C-terminal-related transcriptional regulator [Streptomyces europaeiscabiei]MDX3696401.1 LuxR C-terminal-related transcriptional regulator [Streptomyces europaeiscabiei]
MLSDGLVEAATWKTDRALAVTQAAGAAWKIGLRRGHRIGTALTGDPVLVSPLGLAHGLGEAHAQVLNDRTVSWEVVGSTQRWKVILSPDRAADGSVNGVIGAAWYMSDTMTAMGPAQWPAELRTGHEVTEQADSPTPPPPAPPTPRSVPGAAYTAAANLDTLQSRLPVAVLKVSFQDMVMGANPAAADLFGCRTPDELARLPLHRLTRDGLPDAAADAGEGETGPVLFVRPDGAEFLASCVRIPWPGEPGARELLVLHDELAMISKEGPQESVRRPALTPTEASILELTAQGLTSGQIASRLHFSTKNVEYHLGNLRFRIGGGNRVALIARAYVCGLLRRGVWPPAATTDSGSEAEAA